MDLAKYGPWALIVGSSEAVSAEMARQLAGDGFKLVLTARKLEPLLSLKAGAGAGGTECVWFRPTSSSRCSGGSAR
jgi:short-subunit dehydrogenase